MNFLKVILIVLTISGTLTTQAQEQVRLAFYNILNFPQAPPSNRLEILSAIVENIQPDLFMVAELESENASSDILTFSLQSTNTDYRSAPYMNNTSSGSDLQQLLYYDTSKFELLESSIIPTTVRDINRYQLKTLTDNEQIVEVYIAHLKASTGSENEQLRLDMVQEFTTHLETVNPENYVVFAGDLNLYTSTEPAYQELLDPTNSIILQDPLDALGDWNSNIDFQSIHTQSTRISSATFNDFGAGGGLDSRFDFILLSQNFFSPDATLAYTDASYKSYGNNGNCYNNRLDSTDCDGFYNNTVRSLLYQMSDHLPVIADVSVVGTFLNTDEIASTKKTWWLTRTIVEDEAQIAFARAQGEYFMVFIYDQTGRLVISENIRQRKINVSSLSNGIYFMIAQNPEWPTLKFIKHID